MYLTFQGIKTGFRTRCKVLIGNQLRKNVPYFLHFFMSVVYRVVNGDVRSRVVEVGKGFIGGKRLKSPLGQIYGLSVPSYPKRSTCFALDSIEVQMEKQCERCPSSSTHSIVLTNRRNDCQYDASNSRKTKARETTREKNDLSNWQQYLELREKISSHGFKSECALIKLSIGWVQFPYLIALHCFDD